METLTTLKDETIEGAKELVQVNIDSANGFRAAADGIDHEGLAKFFRTCASQREEFARQLQRRLEMSDEEADDSGSLKGAAHRWWIKARGALQQGDAHAVLAEAERGEDVIKHRYEDILPEIAGSPINDVLLSQYADIKSCHDTVRELRDSFAKSDSD